MIEPGFVKICSLREPEHAEWVVEVRADAFGLIFAESRRQVSIEMARAIVGRSHEITTNPRPLVVGVFVDTTADVVNRVADAVGLDLVQLHGDESPETVAAIERPVIKVLRTEPETTATSMLKAASRFRELQRPPVAFLIDGHQASAAGGTGTRADWALAAELASDVPLVLAGGLQPGNVAEAIARVGPRAVDVSSGVEYEGLKSRDLVRAFVVEARRAFAGSRLEQIDVVPRT